MRQKARSKGIRLMTFLSHLFLSRKGMPQFLLGRFLIQDGILIFPVLNPINLRATSRMAIARTKPIIASIIVFFKVRCLYYTIFIYFCQCNKKTRLLGSRCFFMLFSLLSRWFVVAFSSVRATFKRIFSGFDELARPFISSPGAFITSGFSFFAFFP